jgi:hypothetical protein
MAVVDAKWVAAETIAETASKETILFATYDTSSHVITNYPGSRIFCTSNRASFLGNLLTYLPEASSLPLNGSVATIAFEFASYIGANPIIFMGQDMAFDEGRSHADGVSEKGFLKTDDPEEKYMWVKGQDGQLLKTNNFLNDVREYFVSRIRLSCKNKVIINATEGGAYLEGAEHLPLKAAAEKYLTQPIAVKEKTDAILKTFEQPAKKQLIEAVKDIVAASNEMAEKIELFNQKMFAGNYSGKEEIIIANCQDFFDALRQKPLYLYLKYYLDAVYLFQTLEHRHFCPLSKQIADWTNLLEETKKMLTLLPQLSSAALALLEKD